MGGYDDVVECRRLFSMQAEQSLGWSVQLESPNLIEGEFENMRIRFCWVNGKLQDVVTCLIPLCVNDMNR
jgi:hypothetical protein